MKAEHWTINHKNHSNYGNFKWANIMCAKVPSRMCWKWYFHAAKQNIHQLLASSCTILQLPGEGCLHYSITSKKIKKEKSLFPGFAQSWSDNCTRGAQTNPTLYAVVFFPLREFKVSQGLSRSLSKVHRIFCSLNIYWRLSVHFKADGRPLLLQVLIRQFVLCFVSHLVSHPCRS